MSIRLKILAGCLSLTLVTLLLGTYTQHAQEELGGITTRIYDDAFMSVSYLRAAQNGLTKLNVATATSGATDTAGGESGSQEPQVGALVATAVPDILSDLQVAHDRTMSTEGARATSALRERIASLPALPAGRLSDELASVQGAFDTAVEIYAGDGYLFRRSVGANIDRSVERTRAAMAISVIIALGITFLLSRSVVPALNEAVRIAKAVAGGQLDNRIETRGSGETADMLRALSVMQASIAASLDRIRALMADQASNHASESAIQSGRFEAALNNMTQGLCLFDDEDRLVVFNHRFVEMFGPPDVGAHADALDMDETVKHLLAAGEGASFSHEVSDGRVIAVSSQVIDSGGWVVTYEDVTERRKVEAKFAHMARHDALTGLPNRVLFREHMEQAVPRLRRGRGLAVHSLDLDGFKSVNDTLGHPIGDALLRVVAQRMRECTREKDIVARLGGDEFVVIQEEPSDLDDVAALARRLIEAMSAPFEIDGHRIVIGVSVGISTTLDLPDGSTTNAADALLKSADLALYRAKAEGRGTHRFFEAEMDARLQARRTLEFDLRKALDEDQFELFYQPLVDTEHGKVSGFEALLRWRHPNRGLVSPVEFIPIAEETGLIETMGAWVIQEACREAASWPGGIKVAVNLSPVQFQKNDLVATVSRALLTSGLSANRLELEITESLLMQDSGRVLEILQELQGLGVSISMDDFGTGYSSLSYLQKFPFNKIKIDQSFVRDLSDRPDCVAIVRAVISLGRSLGMSVLAEGVETSEQLSVLQDEGCWDVQGYFFSPPASADHVLDLIASCGSAMLPPPVPVRSPSSDEVVVRLLPNHDHVAARKIG